jgi:hypothetical protein
MSFTQIGGKMIKPDKIHQTLMDILRDPESVPVVFLGHTNGKIFCYVNHAIQPADEFTQELHTLIEKYNTLKEAA